MIIFVCTIVNLTCFFGDLQDFIEILEVYAKTVYFSHAWRIEILEVYAKTVYFSHAWRNMSLKLVKLTRGNPT